ncbi:hypothetical protein PINS_up000802 [Pythium insidiosum]|nr:hypothetical protein PINS_up000802 [Pythium insidiosum]
MTSSPHVLGRALRGGSYLFLQKILTFAINSFILRRLHLSVTGAVTVHFELALATVFLFRDSFRLAFLRMPSLLEPTGATATPVTTTMSSARPVRDVAWMTRQQQLVNGAWLSTLLSWALATSITAIVAMHGEKASDSEHQVHEWYTRVLVMYCAAAMIEALAEPMYLLAHSSVLVGWQVTAQGAGFIVRAGVQYVGMFLLGLDGLLCYGLAEIAYASTLVAVFTWFFAGKLQSNREANAVAVHHMTELLPGRVGKDDGNAVEPELMKLLGPLGVQSLVKYLLTEGDKWVLSLFTTLEQMGVYGIVFHLGSLVPRIVFFPLEEATKTVVSKLSATNRDDVMQARRYVLVLLKLMHLVGFVFVAFGVNYAYTLVLLLYGGEKAAGGVGSALAAYCVYIPFLGLNGISEAFVHSVGNQQQLMRLNKLMGVFFVAYAGSAMLFMRGFALGTVGIILANCVNMGCRIMYCMSFAASYFAHWDNAVDSKVQGQASSPQSQSTRAKLVRFWRAALPDRLVLLAFGLSGVIGAISRKFVATNDSLLRHGAHICVGGICFAVVLAALYVKERVLLREELRQLRGGGEKIVTSRAKAEKED